MVSDHYRLPADSDSSPVVSCGCRALTAAGPTPATHGRMDRFTLWLVEEAEGSPKHETDQ